MLKFFRKIRQKLLVEGSIRKYLLYAIGEVILVIIGILIALSINNQNEERKERLQEQEILIGIKNDFIETKNRLKNTMETQEMMIIRCISLIDIMESENNIIYHDSIIMLLSASLSNFRTQPLTATYDALIGAGNSSIIQDSELLTLISEFSSEFQYGFDEEINSFNEAQAIAEQISPYYAVLWSDRPDMGLKKIPTLQEKQAAFKQLKKDQILLSYLINKVSLERNLFNRRESLLFTTNKILKLFNESDFIEVVNPQQYVGDYEAFFNDHPIKATITLEEGVLYHQHQRMSQPLPLFSYEKDVFFEERSQRLISFKRKNDTIVGFTGKVWASRLSIEFQKITSE